MRRVLALLAATALTACAVGPDYKRPSAPISTTYKEAAGWAPAAPADTLDRGDWWTLFGDPVLERLVSRVKVSNQNVAASEAAYRQARAIVAEQRASLFPTINLTGSGSRSGGGSGGGAVIVNPDGSTSGGGGGGSRSTYRASLGGTWEPDVWGRIRRSVEAARAEAQASEADLAAATLSAQGELAVDYFGLRQAETALAIDQATVEGYARTAQIAENRYKVGTVAHSELLQAQTQLANAQADLEGARQQRATYEHAIAVLVGEAPGNFSVPPLAAGPAPEPPQIPAGVPSTLLQRRPDIAAAERRVAAANARIGVARAAYFPTLTINGSYGFASTALGDLLNSSNSLWSYGLSAAETLFDGGARRAQNRQAQAAYDQAVAQYRQTVLTALQDVEDQLTASAVLEHQYVLRKQAADAANAAEQMVANQYKAGQVSYVELFTAQATAYSARLALAQAEAQRRSTAVALIQALGGGWKQP